MKLPTTSKRVVRSFAMISLATLYSQPATFAQGDLVPPGPPAPTMKTLAQVEPRTPISSLPANITVPGSYYLATNLTGTASGGITISADDVTLDLMGFALIGGTGNGITISGSRTNLAVRNGTVRNWSGSGVDTSNASNGQYQDLRLFFNGSHGLACGPNSTVVNCTAQSNSGDGISAGDGSTLSGCSASTNVLHGINAGLGTTVTTCTAQLNQQRGINVGSASTVSGCTVYINQSNGINVGDGCTVHGCTARSNGSTGIVTTSDCTVTSCTVRRNEGDGISAETGDTVSDCTAAFNGFHGIVAASGCHIRHNNCRQNGRTISYGMGIYCTGENNRIENNNCTDNDLGIRCNPGNIVLRNTAAGNTGTSIFGGTADYDFNATTTTYGPIVTKTSGALGTTSNENHPWANFRN